MQRALKTDVCISEKVYGAGPVGSSSSGSGGTTMICPRASPLGKAGVCTSTYQSLDWKSASCSALTSVSVTDQRDGVTESCSREMMLSPDAPGAAACTCTASAVSSPLVLTLMVTLRELLSTVVAA